MRSRNSWQTTKKPVQCGQTLFHGFRRLDLAPEEGYRLWKFASPACGCVPQQPSEPISELLVKWKAGAQEASSATVICWVGTQTRFDQHIKGRERKTTLGVFP